MKESLEPDIQSHIFRVRGKAVMLDENLAQLYGVGTKDLNKAVRRNLFRFPPDFMFELSVLEAEHLRFQFGTSSWGGRRYRPLAFTKQGVAMLSSVLHSRNAILVNIAIVRAFVQLRRALTSSRDIALRVEKLEGRVNMHDTDIWLLTQDIKKLKKKPGPEGPITLIVL